METMESERSNKSDYADEQGGQPERRMTRVFAITVSRPPPGYLGR
jgi:hypothetical protein